MNSPRFGFFPDEVVLQILSRLPIKSLFRSRIVCKLWYRLVSDKYFIHLYNEASAKNPVLLVEVSDSLGSRSNLIVVDNQMGVSEFSLDFLKDRVKVRASCNGLLCCSSIPDKGVYYVCNPMTREFKLLPKSRERHVTRFYPDGEATLVGLACNLSTQKFNVVLAGYHRTFGHRPDGTFICMVYDSESNKWRKFVSFQDDQFTHMNKNQVVYVNGALHWLTGSCSCILVLDLDYDIWRKMSLPEQVSCRSGNRFYLLESDGCLSVVQISDAWMKIWVLREYEREEWHLVDTVSLRCIKGLVPGIFPICQTGEYIFLATHKQILVFYRKTRVWKEMYSVKNSSTLPLWYSAHAFRSRPATLAMLLGRATGRRGPSMLVRETAARELDERRADWGYSKPVVALDMMWNTAFVVVSVAMLIWTEHEHPNTPIRLWICGYALQCFVHVVLVWVEYQRRNNIARRISRRNQDAQQNQHEVEIDANDTDDEEAEAAARDLAISTRSSLSKRCETVNTMASFLWWIVGFYWVVSGGEDLLQNAPRLYWLAVVFLAFDVFFAIFCVVLACLIGVALCCCLPCIIAILYAVAGQEGASEADLSILPKYRFRSSSEEKSSVGAGKMIPVETSSGYLAIERILLPEDAECCICLSPYEDGTELHTLPCNHHFHATCIVKWLKMNATCPLCKYNILKGNEPV